MDDILEFFDCDWVVIDRMQPVSGDWYEIPHLILLFHTFISYYQSGLKICCIKGNNREALWTLLAEMT